MTEFARRRAQAEGALPAAGRYVTPQRLLVLQALLALAAHQTVEAIHSWASGREPGLALSTVYRTLETLRAVGIVAAFDEGAGSVRYEWLPDDEPHHHLVCRGCGWQAEVDVEAVVDLGREVERRYRFSPTIRHLAIEGICERCRTASS